MTWLTGCTFFTQPDPPPNPKLLVLGHAGSGFFTPINPFNFRPPSSWLGVQYALDLGADGVEVDLQLSRDSVVMLYHDQKLEDLSTGTGCISQHTAAELVQLRYRGGWPYDWFQHEQPITFDTLLARLGRRPTFPRLHLDLHEDDPCLAPGQPLRSPALLRHIAASVRRHRVPVEKLLLVTQVAATLRQARVTLPGMALGLEVNTDDFATGLRLAQAEKAYALVLGSGRVTPAQTAQAHAAGLKVTVFGGRSNKSLRRVLASQPDEVEADNLKRMLELQGRR
ncbi:MAG TPA: glycerophosphodiester phosphodiesterase family protein [Hymenobacter sp.]|uniref:glycerophosphodiester phosphodiesterase n=1 Tax=Hymenobacter sp. TaxID=1898978 RepID=UPI002ED9F06C